MYDKTRRSKGEIVIAFGEEDMNSVKESRESQRKELYTIGLDYGTLSARAILVDIGTGEVMAEAVKEYAHGVLDTELPDGTPVPFDWAFQHPGDYLDALYTIVPQVVRESGIAPEKIIGISADFTGCTLISLDKNGTPLCFLPEYEKELFAWVALWKHHGAVEYAPIVHRAVEEQMPEMLARHGGKISCECVMPRALQMLREAPKIFEAADLIMEAGDWLLMQLTGKLVRSQSMAGFKAFWKEGRGYPDNTFYTALDEKLRDYDRTKQRGEIKAIGDCSGRLTDEMAAKLGLRPGIAVGVALYDAHAAVAGCGVSELGTVALSVGTSGGFLVCSDRLVPVEGTTGATMSGYLPGWYGYATGQVSLGDSFAWFVKNMVPERYHSEAREKGMSVHTLLTEKAANYAPGETGLLALDWWGGNRSILVNAELSGLMLGMTLQTKPEEMYRAMLESVAFGSRSIMESYERAGLHVEKIHAVGGIAKKNSLLMQIYADILNRPIYICKSTQAAALGAAMFAASAAGEETGGYATVQEAVKRMANLEDYHYEPIPEHVAVYQKLYEEFERLHDYFGRGENEVMKRLRRGKVQ